MANRKYAIRLNLLIERNVIKKKCFCQHQLCHGWFIPSRVGQETCLFDLAEKGLLNLYPMINIIKYADGNLEHELYEIREKENG